MVGPVIQGLFDRVAPLWRAAETLGAIIVINLLLTLTAVPVLTLGAGLTATYDTSRRLQGEDDRGAARIFLASLRSNLGRATALWALVAPVGAAIVASWIFLPVPELAVLKTLFTLVFVLVFPYVWAVQARFENTVLRTLRNAVVIALARLPYTLGIAVIHLGIGAIIVATWNLLPQFLAFLLLLGYPLVVFGVTAMMERALAPYVFAGQADTPGEPQD